VQAQEVAELFRSTTSARSPIDAMSAAEIVQTAYAKLLPAEHIMQIETTRTGGAAEPSISRFLVFQRSIDGEERTLIENLEPRAIAGSRTLQVEAQDGQTRTFAFVRTAGSDPFPTTFRLADPFTGTWFDQPDGNRVTGSMTSLRPGFKPRFQILSRRPAEFEGERVHRIVVRSRADRGFDRTELAIAERDFAILEFRHFARQNDRDPSLIARVDRRDIQPLGAHLLPTRIVYDAPSSNQQITVSIRHQLLPAEAPDTLFDPDTFHRPRTEFLIAD